MQLAQLTDLEKLLFSGIGSAIVSGIVAFGAAWVTFRRDYKMREKERARRDVIAFCEVVSDVIKYLKHEKYQDALFRVHDASSAALRLWSLYRDKYPAAMEWVKRESAILEITVFQVKEAKKHQRMEKLQQCVGRAGSVHGYMTRWARDMRRRSPEPLALPTSLGNLDKNKIQEALRADPESFYEQVEQYIQRIIDHSEKPDSQGEGASA